MFEPKEIDYSRSMNINAILKREGLKQRELADKIGMSPENLNRIIKLRRPLTEATAETIHAYFPKYRVDWIMGRDRYMTEEDRITSKENQIRNDAPITVLDTALLSVCHREGIDVPELKNIPELTLLVSQLQDYAEMLMRNYIHRTDSRFWTNLDYFHEVIQEKFSVNSDVAPDSVKSNRKKTEKKKK